MRVCIVWASVNQEQTYELRCGMIFMSVYVWTRCMYVSFFLHRNSVGSRSEMRCGRMFMSLYACMHCMGECESERKYVFVCMYVCLYICMYEH
jgi:hypothetical protein